MRNFWLVFKNGFAHGLNVLVSLGFAVAGTRLLSIDDYGELRTAMTLLPLLMALSLPGYDSVILRSSNLNKPVHLLRIFVLRFSFALAGTFFLLGGIVLYQERLSASLCFFLLSIALLLPFFETGTGYRNYLIGIRLRNKALDLTVRSRLISILLLLLFFGLIFWLGLTRLALLPAYLLALILPVLFFFFSVARRQQFSRSGQRLKKESWLDAEKGNLYAAFGATLAGMVYTLAFSFDKLWIRHELGAAALASYTILVMVPQEGSRLFDAMIPLFYRSLFYGQNKGEKKSLVRAALLIPLGAVLYVFCFYYLSPFVFGEAYRYSFFSVALSGVMLCGISLELFVSHKVFAKAGSKQLFLYTSSNLIITLVVVIATLGRGGDIDSLMLALIAKQVVVPLGFLMSLKATFSGGTTKRE